MNSRHRWQTYKAWCWVLFGALRGKSIDQMIAESEAELAELEREIERVEAQKAELLKQLFERDESELKR